MIGGADLHPFPNNWDIAKLFGTHAVYSERWEQNSVVNLRHLLTPNSLKIISQCGDDFYKVDVALHDKLLFDNIPHTFITGLGGYTWSHILKYQLLFMGINFKIRQLKYIIDFLFQIC